MLSSNSRATSVVVFLHKYVERQAQKSTSHLLLRLPPGGGTLAKPGKLSPEENHASATNSRYERDRPDGRLDSCLFRCVRAHHQFALRSIDGSGRRRAHSDNAA